jgi:hypothetical protein
MENKNLSEIQKLALLRAVLDTETFVMMDKKERDEYFELNQANILSSKVAKEILAYKH